MRFSLQPAALTLCMAGALSAQDAPSSVPWFDVLNRDQVLLQARVVLMDGQPVLQFKNKGQDAIHFNYWIEGFGSKDAAILTPRIHITRNKRSTFRALPAGVTMPAVKLAFVRTGEDAGSFLPE
jgi:hypothetical protein